jgi:DNA-binding CsgD family transcriptional regulator/PAS domain-containing protein
MIGMDAAIASLYRAAAGDQDWATALEDVRDMTAAIAVHLYYWNKAERRVDFTKNCEDMDPRMMQQYNDHYAELDPRRQLASTLEVGAVLACHEHFDGDYVRRSPLYQELLIPNGLRFSIVSRVAETPEYSGYLGINRKESVGPFTVEERRAITSLSFHISNACEIHRRLREVNARRAAWRTALDALSFGLLLVDDGGWIVDHNQAADDILRSADGLRAINGRLLTTRTVETERLAALIDAAAGPGHTGEHRRGGAMAVTRGSGGSVYAVQVAPLMPDHPLADMTRPPRAVVIVTDPARRVDGPAAHLAAVYGLTPAEARMASALMDGRTLEDYAVEAGVSRETARWRLKAVFGKTGTRRQHALAALLLKTLADVRR